MPTTSAVLVSTVMLRASWPSKFSPLSSSEACGIHWNGEKPICKPNRPSSGWMKNLQIRARVTRWPLNKNDQILTDPITLLTIPLNAPGVADNQVVYQ